jgi:cell division septal protein FtsQ
LVEKPREAQARIERALASLTAYRAKQRPRAGEVHVGDGGDTTLYTAERGTQLRLGRGNVEAELERYDALRVALGDMADDLETVHLDGSTGPVSHERVVATFFSASDPALLAQAQVPEPPSSRSTPEQIQQRTPPSQYD